MSTKFSILLPGEIDSHSEVSITSIFIESVAPQAKGNKADVRIVHGLELDAGIGAIKRGLGDEVLDGLNHAFQDGTLGELGFEHDECVF